MQEEDEAHVTSVNGRRVDLKTTRRQALLLPRKFENAMGSSKTRKRNQRRKRARTRRYIREYKLEEARQRTASRLNELILGLKNLSEQEIARYKLVAAYNCLDRELEKIESAETLEELDATMDFVEMVELNLHEAAQQAADEALL